MAAALLLSASVASAQTCQANCVRVNDPGDAINPSCSESGIGTCSLRDAVTLVGFLNGFVIQFSIGTGPQTINLMSNLPGICGSGSIDGTTQPGFAGAPLIEIHQPDGSGAWHGLLIGDPPQLCQGSVTVRSLVINHFGTGGCADCGGIIMENPGGNFILGCYIGTDASGTVADGNFYGILDDTFGGNHYGGVTAADRNVISGNGNGIVITNTRGGYSAQDVIQGNYIGTDATGTAAIPNGIGIAAGPPFAGFAPGILIGGPLGSGAGNVIAGGGGMLLRSGGGNLVQGNLIGLDKTGLVSLTMENGIELDGETNATISNNFISASGFGISLGVDQFAVKTHGTKVQGNTIGTDMTGNRVLVGGTQGIWFIQGPNNTIGGNALAGEGNVIGGFQSGIFVGGGTSTGNVITGNRIGIGVDGSPIPNSAEGIYIQGSGNTTIGGIDPGEGNIIAFNGVIPPSGPAPAVPGVHLQNVAGNSIRGNSIYGNTGLGIDFQFPSGPNPYPNDIGDADTGPNDLQNFPIITSVTLNGGNVMVNGTLNSKPNTDYTLDFYANPNPLHPKDFLQGQTWMVFTPVTTDAQGNAPFSVIFPAPPEPAWISATATNPAGSTSEFSERSLFSVSPTHGPAILQRSDVPETANPVTITGQLFQPGASVTFGGLPAGNVSVVNDTTITATTPALGPGLLVDVLVTNPDTSTALMQHAWVSDFLDVPQDGFFPYITSLVADGTTAGCGGGLYCPARSITRAEMAVFLLKAKYGLWHVPPACTPPPNQVFVDVPCPATQMFPFSNWIEELFDSGITTGCDASNYCPDKPVTRDQMAVFLLKAEHGSTYPVPACVGLFTDVPCPPTQAFPYSDWIEQLFNEQITAGCVTGQYCPSREVRRDEMAVFITKTFKLP